MKAIFRSGAQKTGKNQLKEEKEASLKLKLLFRPRECPHSGEF